LQCTLIAGAIQCSGHQWSRRSWAWRWHILRCSQHVPTSRIKLLCAFTRRGVWARAQNRHVRLNGRQMSRQPSSKLSKCSPPRPPRRLSLPMLQCSPPRSPTARPSTRRRRSSALRTPALPRRCKPAARRQGCLCAISHPTGSRSRHHPNTSAGLSPRSLHHQGTRSPLW